MRGTRIVGSVILAIASWWVAAVPAAPYAYIPSEGDGSILAGPAFSVIDTATNTVVATVPVMAFGITGVAVNPAGTRAWMSSNGSIRVMDGATHAVVATFMPGGSAGVVFDPSGAVAYVANGMSSVFVIDAATHATLATIPVGNRPFTFAADEARARLYVTNLDDETVSVIDTATRSVIATFAAGDFPQDIALHPAGTLAFVTNTNGGTLSVIDTTTHAVVATVPMGDRPHAVDVDPTGTRAYVSMWGENAVKVVDTGTHGVVDTIPLGLPNCTPSGIDVHPSGTRVYVTCFNGGDVRVIDTSSRTVVDSIPVRMNTYPLGRFIGPDIPGAPTIGTATPGDAQATVSFTAPVITGGSVITGYTVTCNPGAVAATGAASPVTVTGLANGIAHSCSVTARNAVGTGPASATLNVTPNAAQAIAFANPGPQAFGTTPTLAATASSGLPVTFTSATPGVCTITTGGTLAFVAVGPCTILADQAGSAAFLPAPQVAQTFAVNAVPPGAPVIGAAVAGNGQASVAFTAPSFTGGSSISSYTATCNPGAIAATGPASPITVTGLANGTAYDCSVAATNAAGTGAPSATASVTPLAAAQAITFANPGPQSFGTTPTLAATASSGLAVTFTSATMGVCTITPGGTLTFVSAGTCTILADQEGSDSYLPAPQVSRTFAVNAVVPGAPTIGAAVAGNGQAMVSFSAPGFTGGSAVTSYTVTCNPGAISATGASSPITVSGLANGTAHACSVRANNAAGTGAASATVNVSPFAVTSYSGPSATGTGTITASFTGGGATCAYARAQLIPVAGHAASPPTGSAPAGIAFAHGLFDFATAGCTAGGTITMSITYPQPLPAGTQYWKYGPTPSNAAPHWYVLPAGILGNSVVFTITDGGLGDDDLAADGTIADQGGPGVPGAATVVPTLSEWAMIVLALLVGAVGMRRMRAA